MMDDKETAPRRPRRPRASIDEMNRRVSSFLALELPAEFSLGDVLKISPDVEPTTIRLALKRGVLTSTGAKKGTKYRRA